MESSPAGFRLHRAEWLAALLATVVIIGLNFFLLFHAGGFCSDEVDIINLSHSSSLSVMMQDSFPILMPLIVKCWSAGLAQNDFALRTLGLVIGLGMAGALWLSARTGRRGPPVLSLILFGLNGVAIFWEHFLRAYGIGSLLIVLAFLAMSFLLKNPTWQRTVLLAIANILSVQALYQNAVFVAGIAAGGWAICILRKDKNAAAKILIAGAVAAISLAPYCGHIFLWTHSGLPRPGFSWMAASDNLNAVASVPLLQFVWIWRLLALLTVALGASVFFKAMAGEPGRNEMAERRAFAGMTLATVTTGYFIFLHFAALVTSPWYFLPLLALAAACFDLAIPLPSRRLPGLIVYSVLFGVLGVSTLFAVRDLNRRYTNIDLIAQRLDAEIAPQDYVIVTPWYFGISFDRYYRGKADWETVPPIKDHKTFRFDLERLADADPDSSQIILDRVMETLKTGHRVWVVGLMDIPRPGGHPHNRIARVIAGHSQSFESIPVKSSEAINDYENESLLMAHGWKENSASENN